MGVGEDRPLPRVLAQLLDLALGGDDGVLQPGDVVARLLELVVGRGELSCGLVGHGARLGELLARGVEVVGGGRAGTRRGEEGRRREAREDERGEQRGEDAARRGHARTGRG
jgi:hypothetical protein